MGSREQDEAMWWKVHEERKDIGIPIGAIMHSVKWDYLFEAVKVCQIT